jgi:hypothetical protein
MAERKRRLVKRIGVTILVVFLAGYLVPERLVIPVEGATTPDWNDATFWYEPWGASGVHKGIDIFAPKGKHVLAATGGLVVFSGNNSRGGNVSLVLGPKWRFHYYAHMDASLATFGEFVSRGWIPRRRGGRRCFTWIRMSGFGSSSSCKRVTEV